MEYWRPRSPLPAAPVVSVSQFVKRIVFVLSLTVFTALGLGLVLGQFGILGVHASGEQDGAYKQMRVYAEVLQKIQSDYVTQPNITDVTDGALHGLLDSLDSDSSYLTPAEFKQYKESPGDGSVGIVISKRYGYGTAVSVLPGSPADQQHIVDGDILEAINGHTTRQLSLAVMRLMLRGQPGTTVEVAVVRPNKPDPDKITLTRQVLAPPALGIQQYDNGSVLYLKPGELTAQRVDQIADQLKNAKGKKIVLDLRDCFGYDLQQGIRLANFFIKQGTIATLSGQKFPTQTFTADPSKTLTDAPVAVLTNAGTFGAPELTAAAISQLHRGDMIGSATFGEASVQKTIDLPDGAALLLTVAKYQGPDGKIIQDDAVAPTVAVAQPNPEDQFQPMPDNGDQTLQKALDILQAKSS
jgi:carboxyl-terminal processing protease